MYMDIFLLYLILKFTKGEKVEDLPSIAFLENQAVVKDLVRDEVEVQERERLQARFKMQLKEYVNSIMNHDKELQLDQKIGLCFFDMRNTQILGESAEAQLTKRKSGRLIDSVATESVLTQNLRTMSE